MADILARIRKLIDLATANGNDHEARTAAFHACRLIKQHGVEVMLSDDPRATRIPVFDPRSGASFDQFMEDLLNNRAAPSVPPVRKRSSAGRKR